MFLTVPGSSMTERTRILPAHLGHERTSNPSVLRIHEHGQAHGLRLRGAGAGVREWFTPFTGFYRRGEFMPPTDPKARAQYEAARAQAQ